MRDVWLSKNLKWAYGLILSMTSLIMIVTT